MAPQVLLPACTLRVAPDRVSERALQSECPEEVSFPEYSTINGICEHRFWKRRKSDSDVKSAKVRFDSAFECNEFWKENDARCANAVIVSLLPYKSPSAAYFDGDDADFGLTPVADQNKCNDQLLPFFPPQEFVQESPASSIASPTSSTGLPDAANAANKRFSGTIQYSYDTLTSRCEDPLPLAAAAENESQMFMSGMMWELSQDVQGCREVQKALEDCKSSRDFHSVAFQLTGHVWEAMRCRHANHVLRKVIQTIPASNLDFVIDEIVQGGIAEVKLFVSHRYGCRIVEELLRSCRLEQLHGLMKHLLAEADDLCMHMYGNFVMKALLRRASSVQRHKLVEALLDKIVTMGTNFYACAVLTEVLQSNDELARSLACGLVRMPGLLSAMAASKQGKAAVDAVLLILKGLERQAAVNALGLPALKVAKVPKAAKNPRA